MSILKRRMSLPLRNKEIKEVTVVKSLSLDSLYVKVNRIHIMQVDVTVNTHLICLSWSAYNFHNIQCMLLLFIQDDSRKAFLLLCSALNGQTEIVQALIGSETNVTT